MLPFLFGPLSADHCLIAEGVMETYLESALLFEFFCSNMVFSDRFN